MLSREGATRQEGSGSDLGTLVRWGEECQTDAWVSMSEPTFARDGRVKMKAPFQVNASVLDRTGNAGVRFLHCLPALHNADTQVGREVTDKYAMSVK